MRYKQAKGERRVTQADYHAAGRGLARDIAADPRSRNVVHLTNEGAQEAARLVTTIQKGNPTWRVFIGAAKATEALSRAELDKMHIVGIYREDTP